MTIKRGIRGFGLTVRKSWTAGAEDIGSDEYRRVVRESYYGSDKPPISPEGVAAFAGAFARHLREQGGGPAEEQSPSWYADEIDARAEAMMGFLDHPDVREPGLAVMYAWRLGMLMKEAMLKFKVEPVWERGRKVLDSAQAGGRARAEALRLKLEDRDRWLAKLVDAVIERNPRLTITAARKAVCRQLASQGKTWKAFDKNGHCRETPYSLMMVRRAHEKFGETADHKPAK